MPDTFPGTVSHDYSQSTKIKPEYSKILVEDKD